MQDQPYTIEFEAEFYQLSSLNEACRRIIKDCLWFFINLRRVNGSLGKCSLVMMLINRGFIVLVTTSGLTRFLTFLFIYYCQK